MAYVIVPAATELLESLEDATEAKAFMQAEALVGFRRLARKRHGLSNVQLIGEPVKMTPEQLALEAPNLAVLNPELVECWRYTADIT